MGAQHLVKWTDERIALLRRMRLAGGSASEIAAAIGNGITRNAVCGKIDRLGLSGTRRAQNIRAVPPKPPKAAPAAPVPKAIGNGSAGSIAFGIIQKIKAIQKGLSAPDAPLDMRPDTVAEPKHISLSDLNNFTCHAIYGEGLAATYCGHMTALCGLNLDRQSPYCRAHHSLYHKPAPTKQRAWADARKRAA